MEVYEGVETQVHAPLSWTWGKKPRYPVDRKLSELHVSHKGNKNFLFLSGIETEYPVIHSAV